MIMIMIITMIMIIVIMMIIMIMTMIIMITMIEMLIIPNVESPMQKEEAFSTNEPLLFLPRRGGIMSELLQNWLNNEAPL